MSSELRNAVALWSDPSPPNDFCPYDHCSANVPFGTMRIEWKSWKDYPGYCLYFDAGETFIGSFDSLDQAKSHAAAIIEQDREAVRAEQAAELANYKALAETLAGALEAIRSEAQREKGSWLHLKRCIAAQSAEALREYKEARDAS